MREISDIVYDSPWDELGVSYKRDAAFIIQRAQISAEPTAWFGTIKIDLPTVIDVSLSSKSNIIDQIKVKQK